jgi:hypothetical protein
MSKGKREKSLICEGCGQTGAKIVCLDDRGLQAGVFQFCKQCTPKLKYRTGDYVIRWFRISPKLPPSRKPHRDVDLFAMPRWGDDDYVSPYEKFLASTQRTSHKPKKEQNDDNTNNIHDEDFENENDYDDERFHELDDQTHRTSKDNTFSTDNGKLKPRKKNNFFDALAAAKEAGPLPAYVKPLKRLALEIAVKTTLAAHHLGAFERLRLRMHDCLQESFVGQMIESNRLFDYQKRKAFEANNALMEAQKGMTIKAIEAHAAEHEVEELPESRNIEKKEEEAISKDSQSLILLTSESNNRDHWKQYSKHFLNSLHSFVWETDPQVVDLSSCNLGPRDLNLLHLTVSKQTIGTLDLKWNLLGSTNAIFLYNIIACNRVHTLHLGWNKLGDDGTLVISKALQKAKALKDLDLTGNGITRAGLRHLCTGLNAGGNENDGVDSNSSSKVNEGNKERAAKSSSRISLKRLNLSFNPFGAEGATELIDGGLGTVPLTHVGLRSCELGLHGAVIIANGFRKNRHLKEMMLADNRVTPEGARQIAKNLKFGPGALLRAFGVGSGSRSAQHVKDMNNN